MGEGGADILLGKIDAVFPAQEVWVEKKGRVVRQQPPTSLLSNLFLPPTQPIHPTIASSAHLSTVSFVRAALGLLRAPSASDRGRVGARV